MRGDVVSHNVAVTVQRVCRPCHYHEGIFAVYASFVANLDMLGRPTADPVTALHCLPHVVTLLSRAKRTLAAQLRTRDSDAARDVTACQSTAEHAATLPDVPIVMIGFSKGSVVLNEMVAELSILAGCPRSKLADEMTAFCRKLEWLHWVDGMGHTRLVPAELLASPKSADSGAPTMSPLSMSLAATPALPPAADGNSSVPWYHSTIPPSAPLHGPLTVVTMMPTASHKALFATTAPALSCSDATALTLPLICKDCKFTVHGTPYQWEASDTERAMRKPQSQWFVAHLQSLGFSATMIVSAHLECTALLHALSMVTECAGVFPGRGAR